MPPGPIRLSVAYMTTTTIVSILVGVAVAALLVVRQMHAQPVNANFRLPLILGIIGLIEVTNYLQKGHGGTKVIAALAGSLVLAAVLGAARAATVHVWMRDGQPWRQGTWLTGVLWVVSLAAHFSLDYLLDPHSPSGGVGGRPSCCTSRSPTPCSGSSCRPAPSGSRPVTQRRSPSARASPDEPAPLSKHR